MMVMFTKKLLPTRYLIVSVPLVMLVMAVVIGIYVGQSSVISGTPRLRGLVKGIRVPAADFSWATNGRVVADPIIDDEAKVMKVAMSLRTDKKCADAGWAVDLIRWDLLNGATYDSQIGGRNGVRFFIRGEEGGERVGMSMKSDRTYPSPGSAASDEEKVDLDSLGIKITREWLRVQIPFARFSNFNPHRARNIAVYTDAGLVRLGGESQVILIKDLTFYGD